MRTPLIALTLLLAAPAAAHTTVVPQRSIAGIKLGMTREQVEARLGKPSEVNRANHDIVGSYTELRYGRTYIAIFAGTDGEVFNITTRSRRERTSTGVGVGSTERQVKRGVRRVRCDRSFGIHQCAVGRFEAGRTVTTFRFSKRGRVKSVSLGRVID